MIASLTGRLAFKAPTHLTLDVQGVGYDVLIPLSTYYGLPDLNAALSLNIHTHVREDVIQLFGFSSRQEKETFLLLTTVSGVGPKTALGILSALPVGDLVSAIHAGDVEKLETIPGIGKKSAGRLILELKDKLGKLHPNVPASGAGIEAQHDRDIEDALSALTNLGYRSQDAKDALKRVRQERPASLSLQELIRHSLKELAGG